MSLTFSTTAKPAGARVAQRSAKKAGARVVAPAAFTGFKAASSMPSFKGAAAGQTFSEKTRASIQAAAAHFEAKGATVPSLKMTTESSMNIVFVSAEVSPWSKTGGLGDVVGGLPVELAKRGHRVMTVAPRYDQYPDAWDTSVTVNIMGEEVRYFHCKKKGVDRVFVDHPLFLAKVWGKTGSKIYGNKSGADFVDNPKRFSLFCKAAIEAARVLPFPYGEDATFVANDWHSGLVPVLLKDEYQTKGEFKDAKVAFCVHNIAFQGRFSPDVWDMMGLPEASKSRFAFTDGVDKLFDETDPADEDGPARVPKKGQFPKLNWLQAGFQASDKNLTVSPNYAREVISSADKGVELDQCIIQSGGIEGIVNGMDTTEWNPLTDKFLDLKYDAETVHLGKAAAKAELQAEFGLPVSPDVPVVGYIGRLEEQKGVDIMMAAIKDLTGVECQLAILGTGKKTMEKQVKALEDKSPNAKGVVKFSAPLAHLITAGADFILVPSRFEPCGLIQLHAMQYGTVPIVASTGGLVDTVKEGVTGFHMGAFDPDRLVPADAAALAATVKRAVAVYPTPSYKKMVEACIQQELSWSKPAKKWEAVLEEMRNPSAESAGAIAGKKASVTTPKEVVETK
eukprot:CAMPEP_0182913272 /NCGR_PEP_ID=MMETSP0034_2-20130328/37952_1 /TAXON_ID=156128 /ORGANISM="Nephroselmis pyriformis, Strain CCMP717" /LENGTH=621 /DNA_ID=CAMNT_0025049985 /DNA_START=21 /DNA_END=1886 /DNA_ORIENTATION=+